MPHFSPGSNKEEYLSLLKNIAVYELLLLDKNLAELGNMACIR